MNKTTTVLALAFALAGCTSSGGGGDGTRKAAGANQQQQIGQGNLAEARALLEQSKFDEALNITDRLLKQNSNNRQARILAARANLGLVPLGRSNTGYLVQDAISNLEQALSLQPQDPDTWLLLSDAHLKNASFKRGRDAALRAATMLQASKASNDKVAAAVLQAADNEMQIFVDSRRAEIQKGETNVGDETLIQARMVLSRLKKAQALGAVGAAHARSATVYQWLGRSLEAIHELERGIAAQPEHFPLHSRFRELHIGMARHSEMVATYRGLVRNHGEKPGLLWGKGIAEVMLGDKHREARKTAEATRLYREAAEGFANASKARPQWKRDCDFYRALCRISLASIALDQLDLAAARRELAAAYRATPRVLETGADGAFVIVDTFGRSYLGTANQLGTAMAGEKSPAQLRAALDYWEEMLALHPNRYGWMHNNAALNARDLATSFATMSRRQEGATAEASMKQAMKLWERSYELYSKAADLAPDDARIVNDCGLMLVYYLKRDYDRAGRMFQQAITVGKQQLSELPKNVDQDERETLEEAVGDAYQNTAVMMRDQGKPFEDYKPFLEQAIKYFPYRGREAQKMLRLGGGDGNTQQQPDPRAKVFAEAMTKVKPEADQENFDAALLELDKYARQLKGHAPFHAMFGSYSLQYAQKAMAGGSATQIDGLLADAKHHLQKSVELDGDPVEPRLLLASAYYESGDFKTAAKVSDSALSHVASIGGTTEALHVAALELRAKAGARVFIADKEQDKTNETEMRATRSAMRALEKRKQLGDKLVQTWSSFELWAGDKAASVSVLERALQRRPDSQPLIARFVETAKAAGQSNTAVQVLSKREDALARWYLGSALYNDALEATGRGKQVQAQKSYTDAIFAFRDASQKKSDFKASSEAWIAICLGQLGFLHLDQGSPKQAEKAFLESLELCPDRAGNDLGDGRSVLQGVFTVLDPYAKKEDWQNAERITRIAGKALPDNPDIANNHGLFARNYGVALEELGRKKEAKSFYEAAYVSYQRAAKLEPHTLRLQNDLALMCIYHLERDLEEAKKILLTCIQKGSKILAENPPKEEAARREIEETVGDSHQNLGYCLLKRENNPASAKIHLEKSLKFYPYGKRSSVGLLEEVAKLLKEGKR